MCHRVHPSSVCPSATTNAPDTSSTSTWWASPIMPVPGSAMMAVKALTGERVAMARTATTVARGHRLLKMPMRTQQIPPQGALILHMTAYSRRAFIPESTAIRLDLDRTGTRPRWDATEVAVVPREATVIPLPTMVAIWAEEACPAHTTDLKVTVKAMVGAMVGEG